MGHALKELWRVLRPGQSLIDLRPLAGQSRVEVIAGERVFYAGLVNESKDILDDLAADTALAHSLATGAFELREKTHFDYDLYWDTLEAMQAYAKARWTKSYLPDPVLTKTREFLAENQPGGRLRIRRRVLIARYQKPGISNPRLV